MPFSFFVPLHHFWLLLHILHWLRFHQLHLLYQITTLCRYLSLLLLGDLKSTIQGGFTSYVMWKSMRHIWKSCVSRNGVQAIVRRPSVVVKSCCRIPMLGSGSNAGHTVDMVCLCRDASVLRFTVLLTGATKRSNMRMIFWPFTVFWCAADTRV